MKVLTPNTGIKACLRLAISGVTNCLLLACLFFAPGCGNHERISHQEGSGPVVLKPIAEPSKYVAKIRQMVYVPIYSSLYWGINRQLVDLAATLSIRNASMKHAIVIHSVKYYDTYGKELKEHVATPSSLNPMATADFVVQRRDESGGPGANFLVEWSSAEDVDEPVIEAVMLGQQGNAGVSFTSIGRVLPKASAQLPRSTP